MQWLQKAKIIVIYSKDITILLIPLFAHNSPQLTQSSYF